MCWNMPTLFCRKQKSWYSTYEWLLLRMNKGNKDWEERISPTFGSLSMQIQWQMVILEKHICSRPKWAENIHDCLSEPNSGNTTVWHLASPMTAKSSWSCCHILETGCCQGPEVGTPHLEGTGFVAWGSYRECDSECSSDLIPLLQWRNMPL